MSNEKGTQICLNCSFWNSKTLCQNKKAKRRWFANQKNNCSYFYGNLLAIDWNKATPVGARPSTFSKNG